MIGLENALEFVSGLRIGGDERAAFGGCIIASLAVRDFLRQIGLAGVRERPVALIIWATREGKDLNSVGVGVNRISGLAAAPGGWDGHMVVTINDLIIDPTFYQIRRPEWDWIPDVAIVRKAPAGETFTVAPGKRSLPVLGTLSRQILEYECCALWLSNSSNQDWRRSPNAFLSRRKAIVSWMLASYNDRY
jgi:hypothetical protein